MSRKWDKNLDIQTEANKLKKLISNPSNKFKRLDRQVKIAILLIAAKNGSRIGEAIEAYNNFIRLKTREVQAKVEKRGYKKNKSTGIMNYVPYLRTFIIPFEIPDNLPEYRGDTTSLSHFTMHQFGYNPHSLRYAYITYLSKRGVSAQMISKITGHKSLNMITDYTQEKAALDILKNEVI